ncbi:MAG: hypothetical protein ACK55I_42240, partial [bacterium]
PRLLPSLLRAPDERDGAAPRRARVSRGAHAAVGALGSVPAPLGIGLPPRAGARPGAHHVRGERAPLPAPLPRLGTAATARRGVLRDAALRLGPAPERAPARALSRRHLR